MVFGGKKAPRFASSHNDPSVVEMKIASAIVRRILIDTGSSVDIITWDCLKKLTHPGHDIIPLEVNPTGMIRLPVRFGDKLKSKNLEVDFLVVDASTAYNVILGRPTIHKDFAQIPQGIGTTLLIAMLFGLSHPFSPRGRFSLGRCKHLFPAPLVLGRQPLQPSVTLVALTPQANASAIITSSLVILGESKRPGARSPIDRLPDCRGADRSAPTSPAWVGADAAISSGRPSIRCPMWASKQMAGFFPRGAREGACSQNNLIRLRQTRDHGEMGRIMLSQTYSAACAMPWKEGEEVVLPLEGPPSNTRFIEGSAG
ncbi:hypothetical protein Cgig2_016467 [Carnegiea gigantea]|uniref:Peptidase A2 domain-containing protein n=1 Tax=Carnegiea gigantea TaxID=171969 RepID=A0A9Q1QNU8_9CARY|nr:hypothetical protein Cgig2_016467 [Carnegiea gigantea]